MTSSPLHGLDPRLTAPKRLAAMAMLTHAYTVDFSLLRDHLALSNSDLSKQMSALISAGYVTFKKSGIGRGSSTTYQATPEGRKAYARHRAALEAILAGCTGD